MSLENNLFQKRLDKSEDLKKNMVKIRKAKKSEIPLLAEIHRKEFRKYPYKFKWSKEASLKKIKGYYPDIFSIIVGNKVAGFVMFSSYNWSDGKRGWINDIVIDGKFQGKGIGSEVLKEVENKLKKKGVKRIFLTTHGKGKALKFYEKNGFKKNEYVELMKRLI